MSDTPALPSTIRGTPFVKGDPRIRPHNPNSGRQIGSLNDTTKAAMELLRARAEEMVDKLTKIATGDPITDGKPCLFCGRGMPIDPSTQVKALIAALDRSGIGPKSTIDVKMIDDTNWIRELSDEQLETLSGWIAEARERAAQAPLGAPEILEATVMSASSSAPQDGPPALASGPLPDLGQS